mmetsp:Transcript_58790/g.139821  ORF Transcript_58790/g.139821 Transcript_58790/m.139821 type:complete len:218 (+) Transcript_58790:430-1083(+)
MASARGSRSVMMAIWCSGMAVRPTARSRWGGTASWGRSPERTSARRSAGTAFASRGWRRVMTVRGPTARATAARRRASLRRASTARMIKRIASSGGTASRCAATGCGCRARRATTPTTRTSMAAPPSAPSRTAGRAGRRAPPWRRAPRGSARRGAATARPSGAPCVPGSAGMGTRCLGRRATTGIRAGRMGARPSARLSLATRVRTATAGRCAATGW